MFDKYNKYSVNAYHCSVVDQFRSKLEEDPTILDKYRIVKRPYFGLGLANRYTFSKGGSFRSRRKTSSKKD